jgi:hypothetical protein
MNFFSKVRRIFKGDNIEELPLEEQAVDVSRDLTPTQQDVYDAVRAFPGATARELGFKKFPEDWRIPGRRLRELVDKGLVEIGDKRRNDDTQIEVLTYYPTDYFSMPKRQKSMFTVVEV